MQSTPEFTTIAQAIAEIGQFYPDHGFVFQDLAGKETSYHFPRIGEETARRAAAMQAMGLGKGDRLGLIVIEPEDFVLSFLAAVRVGVVPVPLYPPMSFGNLDAYADRTAKVLESAGARILVASSRLQNVLWALVDKVPTLEQLVTVDKLREAEGTPIYPEITPDDLAFLQYTSGSTADPKGVMVTHASLVANSRGIVHEGLRISPERGDKGVSWLPLYHDMGLIGFVIAPICWGIPIVFIPTMRFIKRPSVWLDTLHRHRGTASFAPNFAFALAARRVTESDLQNWDLSCVKVLGCGAEPIKPQTMRDFTDLFAKHCSLPRNAVMPAYGMAEATLAIALKPATDEMRTLTIDAEGFSETGRIQPAVDGRASAEHVSCGIPFQGHEVAVLDEHGQPLPDGFEGEICHRGPSVTPGYFNNPEATAAAWRHGWLRTGDLGFLHEGEIFVTGRIKDLIIVNGRNVHPQAVEWATAEVEGVRKGNVVAFSVPGEIGEELVVVLETKEQDHAALIDEVKKAVQRELSLSTREVVCLKPGSLPKTSSGKLQRRKTREMYLRERLDGDDRSFGASGDRVTLVKHVAASVWSRAKAALRT
ncbi:MAG: fatty acyl-AMP ligase [Alphaproteobacteria bacterium]|nr:fatty acyl-AMP ligase [Alphaproteobacteria bacterium]